MCPQSHTHHTPAQDNHKETIIRWRESEEASGSQLLAPTCNYTHMHTHLYICACSRKPTHNMNVYTTATARKRRREKPVIVGHDCNINDKNVATRGSRVEGQPRLQGKLKASLGYVEPLSHTKALHEMVPICQFEFYSFYVSSQRPSHLRPCQPLILSSALRPLQS